MQSDWLNSHLAARLPAVVVVSCLAIHNIDERDLRNHARRLQVVSEAVRVLKPGGRLVITDLL